MEILEKLFKLSQNKNDPKIEALTGLITFVIMTYIIFVNPTILSSTGMDFGAVTVATCLSAAVRTLIMEL